MNKIRSNINKQTYYSVCTRVRVSLPLGRMWAEVKIKLSPCDLKLINEKLTLKATPHIYEIMSFHFMSVTKTWRTLIGYFMKLVKIFWRAKKVS